jgi:hypothetical protein
MFTGGHYNTLTHPIGHDYSTTLLKETQIPHAEMKLYCFVSADNIRCGGGGGGIYIIPTGL